MSINYASLSNTAESRTLRSRQRKPWYTSAGNTAVALSSFLNVATASTSTAKGAWAQVFSSLPSNMTHLYVSNITANWAGNDGSMLFDIGTGAAGSETVILGDLPIGGNNSAIFFPIAIPAGTRVAVRVQGLRTSYSQFVNFSAYRTSDFSFSPRAMDVIGVNTSTLKGVALGGASGSYTEITASTSKDFAQFLIMPSCNSTTNANLSGTLTLAYGAAGSEVDVGSIFVTSSSSTNRIIVDHSLPLFLSGRFCPAGTRLSIKHNFSSTTGYAVSLIGIPYA